ncbi:MAG: metallophosphoesterase [Chitinophagaceae bacterium]
MNTLSLKPILFVIIILVFSFSKTNAQQTITGFVFDDANHNGVKDKNETGIKGVAVSDQMKVVTTGDDGRYTLSSAKGYGLIFISTPDGYKSTDVFWKVIDTTQKDAIINFALSKTKAVTSFTFIHASDTHVSQASLDRMKLLEKITDSVKPDIMLITGDLVKDALRVPETTARSLYELFKSERANIHTTTWLVPGNHEIFGIERHLSLVSPNNPLYGRKMYRYYFGPDYYSFNYGGVHFIALNSLDFEDLWYYGKIDSTQIEWLKQDVASVSPQMPIITFQHVPFYSGGLSMQNYEANGPARTVELEQGVIQYRHVVSNTEDILNIMKKHNYPLALAGHHHYQQKFSLAGIQTRFEQTAAVVGPGGEGNLELPSGVMVYTVKDGKIDEGKFVTLDH